MRAGAGCSFESVGCSVGVAVGVSGGWGVETGDTGLASGAGTICSVLWAGARVVAVAAMDVGAGVCPGVEVGEGAWVAGVVATSAGACAVAATGPGVGVSVGRMVREAVGVSSRGEVGSGVSVGAAVGGVVGVGVAVGELPPQESAPPREQQAHEEGQI